jgi:hypothetical protein
MTQIPDRQRQLIWLQDSSSLIPVPAGTGEAPRPFDLNPWPEFTGPTLGMVLVAPESGALAYIYSFGDGAHLFVATRPDDDHPTYLGPVEPSVLAPHAAAAVFLDWYRYRALPGWPLSWAPDAGRRGSSLKGHSAALSSGS